MIEPDQKDPNNPTDLEVTVRNLREENAKLIQLLRSQGLLLDNSPSQSGRSGESASSAAHQAPESSTIVFDHSDLTLTTNSINTTNQTNHHYVNNHGSTNQQNYGGQTVHGTQSNVTPNFNTVIQTSTQPFVQNNSNTLVQNNTNLIQPINLMNFNNVSLDSLQSFFTSQNNLVYLSQASSSSTTTTTTTTTTSTSNIVSNSVVTNSSAPDSLLSNAQNILSGIASEQQHQVSIRPKPSSIHPNQELVPVIPKIKTDQYESMTRHLSSSSTSNNSETSNLFDNDSNDGKQKYPRPIRPKPSSRNHSMQVYARMAANERKSSMATSNFLTSSSSFSHDNNNLSPTVSLFSSSNGSSPSSSNHYLSQTSSIEYAQDLPSQYSQPKSSEMPLLQANNILTSTTGNSSSVTLPTPSNQSTTNRGRNRKKASTSPMMSTSNSQTPSAIVSNLGRPLAPATSNARRKVTANNSISKRSTTVRKPTRRKSSTLEQYPSDTVLQTSSSPTDPFAESISGFLENFDQELMASNILAQATTTSTSNLLSDEHTPVMAPNKSSARTLDNIDLRHLVNGAIQRQESYNSTTTSMPTLDEFNDRFEHDTLITNAATADIQSTHDFNVESEPIASFMSEEEMRLVEMNFDENTFLKQFDLEDAGIKLSVNSDQNLFANILTATSSTHDLLQLQQSQQLHIHEASMQQNSPASPHSHTYPGSSLINNNVFTTLVPLGLQRSSSQTTTLMRNTSVSSLLPEEGVQLTARHIEPRQVATYESVKYQDILDDLVMVTDQDALRHAQAAAASDPSIISSEFSLALLEATNEIIRGTNIQVIEEASTAFTELQYFYPIEQQQALLPEQLIDYPVEEQPMHIEQSQQQQQQTIVAAEELITDIATIAESSRHVLDRSSIDTSITDLSSILEFQDTDLPADHETTETRPITPLMQTAASSDPVPIESSTDEILPVDYDSFLPPISSLDTSPSHLIRDELLPSDSPLSDSLAVASKPCILFEPISSPLNNLSPSKVMQNEMIIDSGCLDELRSEQATSFASGNEDDIEDLLRETSENQYEIIENEGQSSMNTDLVINDLDQLIEQIEPSTKVLKPARSLERTFSRYKQIYKFHLKHQHESVSKTPREQLLTIPPVKLKLHSIFAQNAAKTKKKKRRKRKASSSPPPPSAEQMDCKPFERPPLRITIRTKQPSPPISSDDKSADRKTRKSKKAKSHHHHHHQRKKANADELETEFAGLTRFEQPLAQLYHRPSPSASTETFPKVEMPTPSPPPATLDNQPSTMLHSGFMIEEQTPPSSIASLDHKQSPPPLLSNQTKNDMLKSNYSHLFDYDNQQDHPNTANNNTFITPPPEIDAHPHPQQKSHSYEQFYPFSSSPAKKRHQHRKSSVTSSTSSKSLPSTDYAIDTEALEPVSPTPISTSKVKNSQNQSSTDYNDISPFFYEHNQQEKTVREHYPSSSSSSSSSTKKSSSSRRPSKGSSSQSYQQPRSSSNHSYRTAHDTPILPPPPPPPPAPASSMHIDPYGHSYHPFAPRLANAAPPPFFNFPFPNPFLNPHSSSAPPHFHSHNHNHHHPMKYPNHHPHSHHHRHNRPLRPPPPHNYSSHQQPFPYRPRLQRQPTHKNSNYMSARDHHSFDR